MIRVPIGAGACGIRRLGLATSLAVMVAVSVAGPTAATDGWLDPTFSQNGWARLPDGAVGQPRALVVAALPTGRAVVGRHVIASSGSRTQALVLGANGSALPAFNGASWRTAIVTPDARSLAGFSASATGGAIGSQGQGTDAIVRIVEVDGAGATVRSGSLSIGTSSSMTANLVRLPGASLRGCYHEHYTNERRVFGFTSSLQPDPAMGPNGYRVVPFLVGCDAIGFDGVGHLYLVAGNDGGSSDFGVRVTRTTTSGVADSGWSRNGHAFIETQGMVLDLPDEAVEPGLGFGSAASPIAVAPDGSVYLAARVRRFDAPTWSAAVVKLTATGNLDTGFSGDGVRPIGVAGGQSYLLAIALDAAARPIISVVFDAAGAGRKAYLGRLTTSGAFDTGFGRNGLIPQTFGVRSLAIDGAGRILTAAWDAEAVVVARRDG